MVFLKIIIKGAAEPEEGSRKAGEESTQGAEGGSQKKRRAGSRSARAPDAGDGSHRAEARTAHEEGHAPGEGAGPGERGKRLQRLFKIQLLF